MLISVLLRVNLGIQPEVDSELCEKKMISGRAHSEQEHLGLLLRLRWSHPYQEKQLMIDLR
jgi:hypothetical protein